MQRSSSALKRKSFPGDDPSYGPSCSDGSQQASFDSPASKRTRSFSASGPEQRDFFSSASSGPVPAADCQSAPLLGNTSAAGWEACSLPQPQQQHAQLRTPLQWAAPQHQRAAAPFGSASSLPPRPQQLLHHQQQQQHLQQQQLQHMLHQRQPQQQVQPGPVPLQQQAQAQQSQSLLWNGQPQQAPVPAFGSPTSAAQEADESMDEDTAGVRRSNSAPDLHVMLQQPLQSMPRMLLGPQQQPLGSSSAVGALVPYTAASTKGFLEQQYMRVQRQQLMEALQQARRERATVIEEIGGPGPAAHGGVWSGVVAAPQPGSHSPGRLPAPLAVSAAAAGVQGPTADASPDFQDFPGLAGLAGASRKRKPCSDAAEAGFEQASKRICMALLTSDDAMDIA